MDIDLTERDKKHIEQIHEQYRRLGWGHASDEPPSSTVSDALHAYLRDLRLLVVVTDTMTKTTSTGGGQGGTA